MRGLAVAGLFAGGLAIGFVLGTTRHSDPGAADSPEIARLREDSIQYQILRKKLDLIADDETKLARHQEPRAATQPKAAASAVADTAPVAAERAPAIPSWKEPEKNLHYLKVSDADWFLKKTQIPDFASELGRSSTLQTRDPRIEGCFSGDVRLSDGHLWQMKTDISFQEGAPLSGNVSVQLSDSGRLFSNSSGTGEVRDLRVFGDPGSKGASSAIIIEASSNLYFQMYPTGDQSGLIGNLYSRGSDPQKLDFKGTAVLERQACGNG